MKLPFDYTPAQIAQGDYGDDIEYVDNVHVDMRRTQERRLEVVRHVPTGRYFGVEYLTHDDYGPDFDCCEIVELERHEVVSIEWRELEQ